MTTPTLQSLLDYQGLDQEQSEHLCAMLGRFLHLGQLDYDCKSIALIVGPACSGKSVIANIAISLSTQHASLRATTESLCNAEHAFIGEVDLNLNIEQAEFMRLSQGRKPLWQLAGLLMGYKSIGHPYIACFSFPNRVVPDRQFTARIQQEIPAIRDRCRNAYWTRKTFDINPR